MATCNMTLVFEASSAVEYADMKAYVAARPLAVCDYCVTWDDVAQKLTLACSTVRSTDWPAEVA